MTKVIQQAPNQFIISTDNGYYFQSYDSIVAYRGNGETTLYKNWDYSKTTAKHVGVWLGMTAKEIRQAIKEGRFKYEDINPSI